ncbi:hypothetical protein MMC17_006494 [Xylographa soralifera]|nr:hypothetical protein [Xylographa soralifera]
MLEAMLHQTVSDGSSFAHRLKFGSKQNCDRYSIVATTTNKLEVVEGGEPGSYATLHTYCSAIFLEALQKGLKIISFPFKSDTQGRDTEGHESPIRHSYDSSRFLIQLRSGDSFLVSNVVFSLELWQKPSEKKPTDIIDLGSEKGLDPGNLADDRLLMPANDSSGNRNSKPRDVFTSVDPGLMPATAKNEQTESTHDGSVDAVREDVLPVAVVSEPRLPNSISLNNNELKPFTHDSQSSTLEVQREAVSIFGHIRRDSHYDDSTTVGATTRIVENDDDQHRGPVQHAPVTPKSTLSLFKDIAHEEVEDHTQDSTSIRVEDLLERAGLQYDTASSPAGRCGNGDVEDSFNSGENTIAGVFDGTTRYTEQSNERTTNTSSPTQHSNQISNLNPYDHQQKEENFKSSLEPGVRTSNLMDDENTLIDVEHEIYTGGDESSESTIVVQPRVISGNSRIYAEMPSEVSSTSNPKSSTSSSFPNRARSFHGSSAGIDATVGMDSIKVQFGSSTNVDTMSGVMKSLRSLGMRKADSTNDCDYLCVGAGSIKMTMNLVVAVALGKLVINDKWAFSSANAKKLLDPHDFIAKDRSLETKLGISLSEAIERGRVGHKPLDGYKVFFTPVVKKDLGKALGDLKGIATYGGATIESRLPASKDQPLSIVISSSGDPQLSKLTADGWRCFTKDIITLTVLRSALDLNSTEFVVGGENSSVGSQGQARGKKRKS